MSKYFIWGNLSSKPECRKIKSGKVVSKPEPLWFGCCCLFIFVFCFCFFALVLQGCWKLAFGALESQSGFISKLIPAPWPTHITLWTSLPIFKNKTTAEWKPQQIQAIVIIRTVTIRAPRSLSRKGRNWVSVWVSFAELLVALRWQFWNEFGTVYNECSCWHQAFSFLG